MKKVIFSIAMMTIALMSCDIDSESANTTNNEIHNGNNVENTETKPQAGNLVSMSDDDFVEILFDLFLEYGPEGALSISFDGDGNLIHDYDPDFDGNPGVVVCEGNGVSFSKCLKDRLEDHPGECLKITYDQQSDTFTADDDC